MRSLRLSIRSVFHTHRDYDVLNKFGGSVVSLRTRRLFSANFAVKGFYVRSTRIAWVSNYQIPIEAPVKRVVAALIWKDGKLLICQRTRHQVMPLKWEFPGGKIEEG